MKRINWHILPIFFGLAMLCAMDRANLSFASPQLNHDLHFSDEVYGLGSGKLAPLNSSKNKSKGTSCLVGDLPFVGSKVGRRQFVFFWRCNNRDNRKTLHVTTPVACGRGPPATPVTPPPPPPFADVQCIWVTNQCEGLLFRPKEPRRRGILKSGLPCAGIFFVGYAIVTIPSTFICARVGAPIFLGSILVMWGLVASLFAVMQNRWQFFILRFILGLTEIGASPGKPHPPSLDVYSDSGSDGIWGGRSNHL
jgi:hypothetical protein